MTANPSDGGSEPDYSGRDSAPGELRPAQAHLSTVSPSMTNDTQETNLPKYMKVPLDWCRTHNDWINEDSEFRVCTTADDCTACDATGFADDHIACPVCHGEGRGPCDFTPLLFEAKSDG